MDFLTLLKGGGPVAVVLLLVSVYAAFVFFYRVQVFGRAGSNLSQLFAQVKADLLAGNVRLALADAARADVPAARVLTAGLERTPFGPEAVQAGLHQALLLEEGGLDVVWERWRPSRKSHRCWACWARCLA